MTKQQSDEVQRFSAWLAEAKRLRTLEAEASVDFFSHIQKGENDRALWQHTGKPTFEALIKGENICDPTRYGKAIKAAERWGWDQIRKHGLDAYVELMIVPATAPSRTDPNTPAEVAIRRRFDVFVNENRTPPSRQSAERIVREFYDAPPREIKAPTDLEEQIQKLKAANRELTRENRRLTKENDRLTRLLEQAAGKAA